MRPNYYLFICRGFDICLLEPPVWQGDGRCGGGSACRADGLCLKVTASRQWRRRWQAGPSGPELWAPWRGEGQRGGGFQALMPDPPGLPLERRMLREAKGGSKFTRRRSASPRVSRHQPSTSCFWGCHGNPTPGSSKHSGAPGQQQPARSLLARQVPGLASWSLRDPGSRSPRPQVRRAPWSAGKSRSVSLGGEGRGGV